MYSSIYRRFTRLLSEMTDTKQKNFTINTYFEKDLGLGKDDLKVLRGRIKDEFGVKLPKNIFKEFNTVGELIGLIEAEFGR